MSISKGMCDSINTVIMRIFSHTQIDCFLQDNFHVEEFVVECRRKVPTETLRDELSIYLKVLQSAMIELINKDYADFVNLSSNLVLSWFLNCLTV